MHSESPEGAPNVHTIQNASQLVAWLRIRRVLYATVVVATSSEEF